MILDPHLTGVGVDALVEHLASEIAQSCEGDLAPDQGMVRELAKGVAAFLAEQGGADCVEASYLVALASRAFSSLGEDRLARRLVLVGTGLAGPAEWEIVGADRMWVLDLRRMTVADAAGMELLFFRCLHVALDCVAEVWDSTSGEGVLGLRHVYRTALALLGSGCGKKELGRLRSEIVGRCVDKVERIGTERGWQHRPRVLNLDG